MASRKFGKNAFGPSADYKTQPMNKEGVYGSPPALLKEIRLRASFMKNGFKTKNTQLDLSF